ncbi:THAP domain-containing protein 11 [Gryllus bimaculatus]|nr:THAP domain-containing protein 11 [Gryllus bimaculatus]
MWTPSELLGSLEGDWDPALLFPETDIYENANKDIFMSDEEGGIKSPLVSEVSTNLTVKEEKEHWRRHKQHERSTQLKQRAVATISVVKTPEGWKPPIAYIKVEKPLTKSSCCVLSCSNSPQRCAGHIKFHSFPGKAYEKERKEMWITAINRVNPDGTPWRPTKYSKVCSEHFVGGVVSNIASHPAYVPSIFAPSKIKTKRNRRVILGKEAQENNNGRKIVRESPNGFEGD